MNWNREKLFENTNCFNNTECEIFKFVTNDSIANFRFTLKYVFDIDGNLNRVMEEYKKTFETYLEEHPFRRVWNKLIKDANMKTLINFTNYGDEYKKYAESINKLWDMPQYHSLVCMILKAFVERDWDVLEDKFNGSYNTYEEAQTNIEYSCYTIIDNLDTEDLKTILKFCGIR